ncbi:50S ribosomal protein L16 [Patescibacteria group bacterium]|nr:MAG: 50S ribosomal protein L16 [Patescibacteria group bacterium]
MLFPKKVKYRKWQRSRVNPNKKQVATRGITLAFGSHGLKALTSDRISSNQLEAARRAGARLLGKTGRVWIRVFPDRPDTKKGGELPMGKGKGDPYRFVVEVKPGRILFEIDGVTDAIAREALRKAATKLSVKTTVIARH